MTNRPEPAQAPQILAELCCYDLPRDAWARVLLRARQVGAAGISIPVWPGAASVRHLAGLPDRLADFVQECARLAVPVVLDFHTPNHDALSQDIPLGPRAARPQLDPHAPAGWIEQCAAVLQELQAPHGPIVGLSLGADQAELHEWLRDQGWSIPSAAGLPFEDRRHANQLAATMLGRTGLLDCLVAAGWSSASPNRLGALPLLRADISARPHFWQAKAPRMLLGAALRDDPPAHAPADLALIGGPTADDLARELAAAGIAFDRYEPGAAGVAHSARYALVLGAGDAGQIGASAPAQIGELIEARGGHARYAWADAPDVDVGVRYGAHLTYLFVHNRRASAYNGMLTYRAPDGDVLHLHIGIGAGRTGIVLLSGDEVAGVALDGDGAEGGWLARGLTSSTVFNAGAGGVAPCGSALLLTAPQSGRFQLRRRAGWEGMQAFRLLLSGELLPARLQVDAAHVLVPYTAEDECGQTDLYLLCPAGDSLPAALRDYLAVPLRARAAELHSAAELAGEAASQAGPLLKRAALALTAAAQRLATIDDYAAAWPVSGEPIAIALGLLRQAARTADEAASSRLNQIFHLIARESY